MQRSNYLGGTALAAAMLMGMASFNGADAQQEYVSKAKVETLHKAALPGVEGKEVIIKHFAIPPGFVGGRHYHPGPVFVYVLKGELTVTTKGGTETYKAGQIYPEPLNDVMQGKNLSTSDDLELVVFQVGDVGKPMMIKAD
ncbi:MAG: cupin domain-containing protein [Kiloniellaceae bacterium]